MRHAQQAQRTSPDFISANRAKARLGPAKPVQSELLKPDVCFVIEARQGRSWR